MNGSIGCHACGALCSESALVCPSCGTLFEQSVVPQPVRRRRARRWPLIGGLALAWMVSLLAVVLWLRSRLEEEEGPVPQAVDAIPACLTIVAESAWAPLGSQGSGFVVSPDGLCVTNHHVLVGTIGAVITLGNGRSYDLIHVESYDETHDLLTFRIGHWSRDGTIELPSDLEHVEIGELDEVGVGTRIATVASPHGLATTMAEGLVSAVRATVEGELLQLSIPVSMGSSGGPVFDASGKVIGVLRSQIGLGEGLTFASPVSFLAPLLEVRKAIPARTFGLSTAIRSDLALEDEPIEALIARGNALIGEGRIAEARREYLAALEIRPYAPAALFNAALSSQLEGDVPAFEQFCERFLQYAPLDDEGRGQVQAALLATRFERFKGAPGSP